MDKITATVTVTFKMKELRNFNADSLITDGKQANDTEVRKYLEFITEERDSPITYVDVTYTEEVNE